jgi:hypothetical protein
MLNAGPVFLPRQQAIPAHIDHRFIVLLICDTWRVIEHGTAGTPPERERDPSRSEPPIPVVGQGCAAHSVHCRQATTGNHANRSIAGRAGLPVMTTVAVRASAVDDICPYVGHPTSSRRPFRAEMAAPQGQRRVDVRCAGSRSARTA